MERERRAHQQDHFQELECINFNTEEWCEGQEGRALKEGEGAPTNQFAEDDGGPRYGGNEHLSQETELPVPHHRHGGEDGAEEDSHAEDAGDDKLRVGDSALNAHEFAESAPDYDEPEQRPCDGPQEPAPLAEEPFELS